MLATGREFVTPGEFGAVEPAARGEFPFGLGRQVLAGPFGVGLASGKRHVHDRMIVEPVDVALRTIGVTPVGAEFERPPFAPVSQIDRMLRRREDQRAGLEHVRQRAGIVLRVRRNFRESDVTGRLDELRNWRLVTGVRSIQNPSTVTRWTGASSG